MPSGPTALNSEHARALLGVPGRSPVGPRVTFRRSILYSTDGPGGPPGTLWGASWAVLEALEGGP
eukprot:6991021-Pyramimonas_sp.AAC.1